MPLRRHTRRDVRVLCWFAACLVALSVCGCSVTPADFTPWSADWSSSGVPASVPASVAAAGILRVGALGTHEPVRYLFPVFAPSPGKWNPTWSDLGPTGVVIVVTQRPRGPYMYGKVFGIRPNTRTGKWEYLDGAFGLGLLDADGTFSDGLAANAKSLGTHDFQIRLVPTNSWVDWMVVRTGSGKTFASPIRPGSPGHPQYVDGRKLVVGELFPVSAIAHLQVEW